MKEEQQSPTRLGLMVGAIAAVVAVMLGVIGFIPLCGCLAGPLSWATPAGAGLVAGGLAASRANWTDAEPGRETSHGVGVAARAGAVAGAVTAAAFLLVALLSPIVAVARNLAIAGLDQDVGAVIITSLVASAIGLLISFVVAIGSAVAGVGLAAAAGAILASSASKGT